MIWLTAFRVLVVCFCVAIVAVATYRLVAKHGICPRRGHDWDPAKTEILAEAHFLDGVLRFVRLRCRRCHEYRDELIDPDDGRPFGN